MDYKQSAAEIAANKATFVASGASIFLGLTANEIAALGGLVVAILALIINAATNWHFKAQHLKIARAKAAADGLEIDDEL